MKYPDPSPSMIQHGDGAESCVGMSIELHPGRPVQLRDAPFALQFAAVVADSRSPSAPGAGICTVRLSLVPGRGEVSTFYLSLDPDAPELASVSAFGYRVTLRDVTSTPAEAGARHVATIVVDRME